VTNRLLYFNGLELVTKIVRLAESTAFAGERDAALRKAWEIAVRAGVRSLTCGNTRYVFDASQETPTMLMSAPRGAVRPRERPGGR